MVAVRIDKARHKDQAVGINDLICCRRLELSYSDNSFSNHADVCSNCWATAAVNDACIDDYDSRGPLIRRRAGRKHGNCNQ